MVKPIGPSPQSARIKPDVEQPAVDSGKEQATSTNKTVPIYSEKAQNSRKAEHSFAGQAQAMKLAAELQRAQGGSMMIPRMKWEVNVSPSENTSVPTPYPNIANANQKTEPKK
jgi:hypothetical protein